MSRDLLSLRHAVIVIFGAALIWVANAGSLPLLARIPGFSDEVSEWLILHPTMPAIIGAILFLIVAAIVSSMQEAPRTKGMGFTFLIGGVVAVVTFASRFGGTPSHLYDIAAVFAVSRAVGVVAAGALMYAAKRRWDGRASGMVSRAV
ncbi:MAG: hypothetical protein WD801_12370 [Gemmatimonadaceae bacterium]